VLSPLILMFLLVVVNSLSFLTAFFKYVTAAA
jgi:hypothetical protein